MKKRTKRRIPNWNQKFAWWWLSRHQKEILSRERQYGRFGGTPGIPKYWKVQDEGMPEVQIGGRFYIDKAKPQIKQLVQGAMARAIRSRW